MSFFSKVVSNVSTFWFFSAFLFKENILLKGKSTEAKEVIKIKAKSRVEIDANNSIINPCFLNHLSFFQNDFFQP